MGEKCTYNKKAGDLGCRTASLKNAMPQGRKRVTFAQRLPHAGSCLNAVRSDSVALRGDPMGWGRRPCFPRGRRYLTQIRTKNGWRRQTRSPDSEPAAATLTARPRHSAPAAKEAPLPSGQEESYIVPSLTLSQRARPFTECTRGGCHDRDLSQRGSRGSPPAGAPGLVCETATSPQARCGDAGARGPATALVAAGRRPTRGG